VFPSKAGGQFSLSVRVAVPILTSRYTYDTILHLREAFGIPQMQYFAIFITRYSGPERLDQTSPSMMFTSSSWPGFLLWVVPRVHAGGVSSA